MFSFLKIRRARSVVLQTFGNIDEGIRALSPVERAATLAHANAMVLAAGAQFGADAIKTPMGISEEKAIEIVFMLQRAYASLRDDILAPLQKRNTDDVIYAQTLRQLRAIELMIITYGVVLDPKVKSRAINTWKMLWQSRSHAADATRLLIEFSKHAKASPVVDVPGRQFTSNDVYAMASHPPGFLRKPPAAVPVAKVRPTQ